MNAAMPPAFCASAMTCSATVVLPEDSGPKISADPPAREAAHAQRRVERDRAARDRRHPNDGFLRAQPQNGALAELLLDLAQGKAQHSRAFFFVHSLCDLSAGGG